MKKYNKNRKTQIKTKQLTKYEEWIFKYIRKYYLTPEQVLKKRNNLPQETKEELKINNYPIVKIKSIYKTIKNIESKLNEKIMFTQTEINNQNIPKGCIFRLHAQAFSIKILEKTSKYTNILKTKEKCLIDNNTVLLYENNITIWSNKDFFGKTVQECLNKEAEYWNYLLKKLQLELGVLIIKRNNTRLYEFRKHISSVNDPMAKTMLKQKKHYHIHDDKGELIFIVDDSFSMKEVESVHKTKCVVNINRYEKELKDYDRHPNSLLPSELTHISEQNTKLINQLLKQDLQQQQDINNLIKLNQVLTDNVIKLTTKNEYEEDFKPSMSYLQ